MVDMHIHTLYSDGDKSIEEVLKLCEDKKLEYISITDHNNCRQYEDRAFQQGIFTGKVIIGAEMSATMDNGKGIEFLAYNIKNQKIINEWADKFFSYQILKEKFDRDKNKVIDICNKNNLIYNKKILNKDLPVTDFFVVHMYFELIKYKENFQKMNGYINNFNDFRWNCLANPKSIFYMGEDNSPKPNFRNVADIIHKAGGLVFLAHPFEYRFENTIEFIDELRGEIKLDGLECYHPSAEKDNRIDLLIDYARKNNLYMSGGSDFHGDKKPNNYIGIGNGTLKIPTEIVEQWVNLKP